MQAERVRNEVKTHNATETEGRAKPQSDLSDITKKGIKLIGQTRHTWPSHMFLMCPDSAKGKGTTERQLPMGRNGTTSGQEGLGKGQAHLAEDIPMKGDILISRANMGHAYLLPLDCRQCPIQESWVSNLQNQAGQSLTQQLLPA